MEIEQEAHRAEMQRKKEQEEKQAERRRRMGLPQKGETRALTREEQEARIWAFMYALHILPAQDALLTDFTGTTSQPTQIWKTTTTTTIRTTTILRSGSTTIKTMAAKVKTSSSRTTKTTPV